MGNIDNKIDLVILANYTIKDDISEYTLVWIEVIDSNTEDSIKEYKEGEELLLLPSFIELLVNLQT